MRSSRRAPSLAAAAVLLGCLRASAGTLIFRSSADYSSGGSDSADALVVSPSREIYASGNSDDDFFTIRYDTNLVVLSSADFSDGGSDTAYGVALDGAGNVYVAGEGSSHLLLVKYGPTLSFISSATLSLGLEDTPQAVAVDGSGDVYVAGTTFNGSNFAAFLAKFSSGLGSLGQTTWSPLAQSWGYGLALDGSGDPIVVGQAVVSGGNYSVEIGRFSPSLSLLASSSFATSGADDQGRAVAVSTATGAIYVAAQTGSASSSIFQFLALRFDASLAFVSSATYDIGGDNEAAAISLDPSGNPFLSGTATPTGGQDYAMSIKYAPSLAALSSTTVNAGYGDDANGSGVDVDGSLYTANASDDGSGFTDFVVRRFDGPPVLASSTPGQQGQAGGQFIDFFGDNFVSVVGPPWPVTFSDPGITVNASGASSPTEYVVDVTIPNSTPLGNYDVSIVNPDGSTGTARGFFPVEKTVSIPNATGGTASATSSTGTVTVTVPAGTFGADVSMTLSSPSSLPAAGVLRATGVSLASSVSPSLSVAAGQSVSVSMSYNPASLGAIAPTSLFIAYYDTGLDQWEPLSSVVNTGADTVTSNSTHLGDFQLMAQPAASGPAASVTVYPNPYKPGSGGAYGDGPQGAGLLFANLPTDFTLRVYDSFGREVFSTSGSSSGGRYLWDTSTIRGGRAGSGVYVFLVLDGTGGVAGKGKFAIIR